MTYKITYDDDAVVLTVVFKEKGKLSHAEEVGDIILWIPKGHRFSWSF
jgi:hypothetical protein